MSVVLSRPRVSQRRAEVTAGTGFFIDYPRVQTFGLGRATAVKRVRIIWPGNPVIQNLGPSLEINQRHEVFEP